MVQKIRAKPRLTPADWVYAGIDLLVEGGIAAVRIDRLASSLGVTRGSFYHHFKDREALLHEMLDYWVQKWTYSIFEEITLLDLGPATTLITLIKMVRGRNAAQYEATFRAWALHDPMAKEVVRRADEERLSFIRKLFQALGFKGLDAENRARLFLYYEMSEPAMFAEQTPEMEAALIGERHRLLTVR